MVGCSDDITGMAETARLLSKLISRGVIETQVTGPAYTPKRKKFKRR